ncbi:aspartyl-phosphate phosphatase Spo0E family protein [Bacillus sp. CECT 9360]|uniref:aspartyl-phosphate phosphatase Spo0E family protein n=1 Tax=Bacillus sp. CECT 9360 TaxID=2845821 RepID=UPI001EF9C902|nr:aspartyl-phosphate phosphatase Spo0E family protein [Bacillus sp. CECT 9360]CAH0345803.1 hypothetical protein BCI9360_02104 [Bacillus sp. CECT 9360]
MLYTESKHNHSIEEKRQEMMKLANVLGYTSPDTIKASQELDRLMNTKQSLILSIKK